MLLLIASVAGADRVDIFATPYRDGTITSSAGMGGGCPGSQDEDTTTISVTHSVAVSAIHSLDWFILSRAATSFNLNGLSGTVDSARIVLTVSSKTNSWWNTDVIFTYGDCCIGGGANCTLALSPGDWSNCANNLITVPWGDIPAVTDSLYISVNNTQLPTLGSGHTFDLRMTSSREDSLCSRTDQTAANGVYFHSFESATPAYRPRLIIWYTPAAGRARIIDIDPSDIDLSNPQFIRKESD